jgi:ketosteroid isomerase-like protein
VPTEIQVGSETAVEIGRYRLAVTVDGASAVADEGNYVVFHRRQPDGTWLRAVDVFNPDDRKEEA